MPHQRASGANIVDYYVSQHLHRLPKEILAFLEAVSGKIKDSRDPGLIQMACSQVKRDMVGNRADGKMLGQFLDDVTDSLLSMADMAA